MNENRFDKKGAAYSAAKASYPDELLNALSKENIIAPESTVADIGAGTGIFHCSLHGLQALFFPLSRTGHEKRSRKILKVRKNVKVINGSAENTGLDAVSIDCVTAAKAFHWFNKAAFSEECKRILKPAGAVVLVWNIRDEDDPLIKENYGLNKVYCSGFGTLGEKTGFSRKNPGVVDDFFGSLGADFKRLILKNNLAYDLDTFIMRNFSSSYAPTGGAEKAGYEKALKELFESHAESGMVQYPYITECFYGKI